MHNCILYVTFLVKRNLESLFRNHHCSSLFIFFSLLIFNIDKKLGIPLWGWASQKGCVYGLCTCLFLKYWAFMIFICMGFRWQTVTMSLGPLGYVQLYINIEPPLEEFNCKHLLLSFLLKHFKSSSSDPLAQRSSLFIRVEPWAVFVTLWQLLVGNPLLYRFWGSS